MYHYHLALLILVFGFVPSQQYSLLLVPWIGFMIVQRYGRLSSRVILPILPVLLLLIQGTLFGEFNDLGAMGKDGWYILKMLLVVQAGLILGYYSRSEKHWIQPVAWAAAIVASGQVYWAYVGSGAENMHHVSFISVFLVPFVLKFYPGSRMVRVLLVLPALFTLSLVESRTSFIVLFIAYFGVRGIYLSKSKTTLTIIVIGAIVLVGYQMLPQYSIDNITFLGKLQNSIREMLFEEGLDERSMNANWRGFENFRAYLTWKNGSLAERLFGGGFGTYIDLGKFATLGDNYRIDKIPFAHNGYFSVLVKFGLVGLFSFLYFVLTPFFLKSGWNERQTKDTSAVAISASIVLVFTTFVISGPLNKESIDGISLIFGFSVGMIIKSQAMLPSLPPNWAKV